jgi:hypothetical protein
MDHSLYSLLHRQHNPPQAIASGENRRSRAVSSAPTLAFTAVYTTFNVLGWNSTATTLPRYVVPLQRTMLLAPGGALLWSWH